MSQTVELPSGKGKGDENFPVGSLLIRRDLREHVHAFYDFARNADDIADSADLRPDDKLSRLDVMQAVLTGMRDLGSPTALRLRRSLARTGVVPQHSLDLLHAFRQDATKRRYGTWEELLDYCRYSAAPVGRHVLDLHGEDKATYLANDALCAALQVLNHLQDCAKDLKALDRCYLPQDWLREAGIATASLQAAATGAPLRAVLDRLLDATDALNRIGDGLPPQVRDRRLRMETAVITGLSNSLARRLRREDPLATRVKLRRGDVAGTILRALPRLF